MKFIKKPVTIDAFQWNGDFDALDAWLVSLGEDTSETADDAPAMWPNEDGTLGIGTLEGEVQCVLGGYIIRGVDGEYYPNNDISFFEANNTPASEPNRYTKNPIEVEAVRLLDENLAVLKERFGLAASSDCWRSQEAYQDHAREGEGVVWTSAGMLQYALMKTPYGILQGDKGDWAITDPKGGTRFCKPGIFEQTYEAAQ